MSIPTLPTDNLYKFMAIFGLTLMLSSFYFMLSKNIELYEMAAISDFKTKLVGKEINRISFRIDELKNMENKGDFLLDWTDVTNQNKTLEKEFEAVQLESAVIKSRFSLNNILFIIAIFLVLLGGFLIKKGFTLWYYRYQIYIDAETKYNGEKFIKLLKELEQKSMETQKPKQEN